MQDDRKISLCIPNYNRVDMALEAFEKVYDDERISEIIISDDHSGSEYYYQLQSLFELMPKVKMFRNESNVDCYRNKKIAIELATNEWCILLDSDNIISTDYLDKIYKYEWVVPMIYTPDFAAPHFDFRKYSGLVVDRTNVKEHIDKPFFEVCLNACNYFVNRNEYLKVWDGSIDPVTSDSIYFISRWLAEGNLLRITEGLTYQHRVHDQSHYKNNVHRTPNGFHESILNKLKGIL